MVTRNIVVKLNSVTVIVVAETKVVLSLLLKLFRLHIPQWPACLTVVL